MSAWQSAFLHEFPRGNLRNYLGPPGVLEFVEGSLPTVPKGYLIHPNRWLRYSFQSQFTRVIGVDITLAGQAIIPVVLIFPPVPSPYFQIGTLGGGTVKLFIATEGRPNSGRVKVEIAGQAAEFTNLNLPSSFGISTFRLQVRWHTSGQIHVWHNGSLVAYRPGFAAGVSFGIGDAAIGNPAVLPSATLPSMDVSHFYVKVLREQDAELTLSKEIALAPSGYDPCLSRVWKIQDNATASFRHFMSTVVSNLTTAWTNNTPGGPFSSKAISAHAASNEALIAFINFIRTRDDQYRGVYLDRIRTFLTIVAEAEPARFSALVAETRAATQGLSPECQQRMEALYEANKERLKPVRELLDETAQIVIDLGGA